jgi:YD repeat-containing protein
VGRRVAHIAPGEHFTRYRLDENNRLVEVTNAAGAVTRRAYRTGDAGQSAPGLDEARRAQQAIAPQEHSGRFP